MGGEHGRDHEFLHDVMKSLLRACDVILGSISVGLAVIGTVLLVRGQISVAMVVALWAIPVWNVAWSAATSKRDRMPADLIRAAVSLPLATYVYVGDHGALARLWIPSVIMAVGTSLMIGIASRRAVFGYVITTAYAAAQLLAAIAVDMDLHVALRDAAGVVVTGYLIAIVGSKLGSVLAEARRQRDDALRQQQRAETALGQLADANHKLREEMDRRMQMEIELRQAQKLESVGRLAAGVAHEINTPIQFVSDSVQFLRSANRDVMNVLDKLHAVNRSVLDGLPVEAAAAAAAAGAAEAEADLDYLRSNIPAAFDRSLDGLKRVTDIVRSMKVFAHPGTVEMSAVDLNDAIRSTLTIARHEYKLVAEVETELGELPPVLCHVGEISQVVLNIVVNAAHAIGDVVAGTGRIGRISVRTRCDGDDVVIAIQDTGAGIPEGIRDRIFDPFYTTKAVGFGTGQGLAVARSIVVDKHHGALSCESTVGVGSTFSIRLPIDSAALRAVA